MSKSKIKRKVIQKKDTWVKERDRQVFEDVFDMLRDHVPEGFCVCFNIGKNIEKDDTKLEIVMVGAGVVHRLIAEENGSLDPQKLYEDMTSLAMHTYEAHQSEQGEEVSH